MASETIVPIFDPERGFRIWHIDEIYRGAGGGSYVPNKYDMVLDWEQGMFKVIGVDSSTGLSTLEKWEGPKDNPSITEEGLLLGVDVGAQGESYRLYIDTSVTPHTMACDARLHVFGSSASSVKIFEGTDISDNGKVISAMYDAGGTLLGENIPLELVAFPEGNNLAIKTPVVGYTLKQLPDGEVVTAVVYDDLGHVISYSKLLVKNTSFVRTTEANRKYVTSIHLESPFLSESDNRLLRFPVNMAVNDVPATGVVTYSDGSIVKLPANGGRFKLFGLDNFVSTIVGQKVPLALTYILGADEYCYGASVTSQNHITEEYWGTTTELEKSYSIKIYSFPQWVDEVRGYELRHYLVNLNRSIVYDVTNLVTLTSVSNAFSPLAYGVKQKLSLSINMNEVNAQYPEYKFIQTVEITLLRPGTEDGTKWLIGFTPNQEVPYGEGVVANAKFISTDQWEMDISSGFHSKEEWLRNVYYATEPLFNLNNENMAPEPNVLVLRTKRRRYEVSIDDWGTGIPLINDLGDGENLVIEFINRVYENDIKLGVAALPVKLI